MRHNPVDRTPKFKLFFPPCLHVAECEKLMEIYERLEELDADKAEVRASRILFGLGFTPTMQHKKLKDFSGGWRMRVSLARYDACMIHLRLIKNISCNDIHTSALFFLLRFPPPCQSAVH